MGKIWGIISASLAGMQYTPVSTDVTFNATISTQMVTNMIVEDSSGPDVNGLCHCAPPSS